ncbi:aminotransferase class III-fold pyridoxal phosphate-dependent enzyme [Rhodobacteraceae bacterium CCMM004]|nr:aminotransferase class III-fold pyridoxal phosphate-dependent enzyme [Rhodobacteraceae bacterium CCMM004]
MRNDVPNSWQARAEAATFYGFTDLPTLAERGTVVLTHGEGAHVVDTEGRRYLDANAGLWNMVAGFDHPDLIAAAKAQYDRLPGYHAFFGRMSDATVELSERLTALAPFDGGRVFYTNSGSEANDTLVKMLWFLSAAEGRPLRRKILTRVNGYHGVTVAATSMTGKPYNRVFGLPLPGFLHLTCPHYWREGRAGESEAQFTARLAAELEEVIEREGAGSIAAFVAEPVLGAGGVIPPPEGYFQAIQPVLAAHGIPLVADEVICGFGRTGALWGAETYGFTPDAVIASKAMTAGYFPMGAVILGPDLAARLTRAAEGIEEFPHGFTASGHPVGSAVALAAIDLIVDGGLMAQAQALIPRFEAGLAGFADHPNVGEVRGKGLMGALEVVADRESRAAIPNIGERVANAAMDRGLICRPIGPAIVLCPPFILSEGEMDGMFATLRDALDAALGEAIA